MLPGVAKLRVAGAVEEEIEGEVGGLQYVGDDQRQLEDGRVVVTHDVVAQCQKLGRRHQQQETDDDRHENHRQPASLRTRRSARHHAGRCSDDGPVSALDTSRLAQRLNQSRRAEQQDGGREYKLDRSREARERRV